MKKEDFLKLGVSEELAAKCESACADELKGYIPKARFDEVNNEKKKLEADLGERDAKLEQLKTSAGDLETLKKQVSEFQKEIKAKDEAHAAELAQIKLDNAVDTALTTAGAKNIKAVRALLNASELKLGEDGALNGLAAQLDALRKSDAYLFKENEAPSFKGFQPGQGRDGVPGGKAAENMSYSEMCAYLAANPGAKI